MAAGRCAKIALGKTLCPAPSFRFCAVIRGVVWLGFGHQIQNPNTALIVWHSLHVSQLALIGGNVRAAGDVAEQAADRQPFGPWRAKMLTADTANSDEPIAIDRRSLLTAAAIAAASTIPVTAADAVCEAIQSCILPPGVGSPKVCAATARRLLEIHRRNELRREAQLPVLPIAKELRRMKEQEELEAFRQFEAANGGAVWEQNARGAAASGRQLELAAQLDGGLPLSESSSRCSPSTIWSQAGKRLEQPATLFNGLNSKAEA
jgi:hypothetical protein